MRGWKPGLNFQKRSFILLALFFLFLGSGCSPVLKNEQTIAGQSIALPPGHSIGQSFVASERGLTAIDVLVEPGLGGSTLALSLYPDTQREQVIATSRLELHSGSGQGYQRFSFPALKGSARADYYLELKVEKGPGVNIYAAPGEIYLHGALYQDRVPQDLQLAFRLAYDRLELGSGLLSDGLQWLWILLLGGWLFVLPGWALLRLLSDESWSRRPWAEKAALAAGAGLALYPVLLLWLSLLHLRLGNVMIWVIPIIAVITLAWKNYAGFSAGLKTGLRWRKDDFTFSFAFLAVLAMVFFSRFWVIRNVEVPLWGDSYQHTMIAQLIAENRGLFDSWEPYEPYQSLTVQYGFSANTAAWMWLTGMESPRAALVFGQLLNFFAILALYPLGVRLAKGNRWAGIVAMVIAGLFSAMPAFYVNWGRYAQLMGLAILPAALRLLWDWVEEPRTSMRQAVVHGILLAGLLLSYYRMAFFYAMFIPVMLLLAWAHGPLKKSISDWRWVFVKLAATALVGLILISPWLPNVSGSTLSESVGSGITTQSSSQGVWNDYQAWTGYQEYVPVWLLGLVVLSLVASLGFRRLEILGLLVWLGLISAVKAGSLVHLPGANMMQSFAVIISLYLFVGLAGAWLPGWAFAWMVRRYERAGSIIVLVAILGASLAGLNVQRKILNPQTYAIVTLPDLRAMEWIRVNTPGDAVFLVEGFRIYNGRSAVGSDGGWWIPLLARRMNTMPPQYALLNEQPEPPDYSQKIVELVASLESHSPADPAVRAEICQRGITHIYVGQQQGKASMEKIQLFPAELDGAGGPLQKIYAQDRVRIYAFPVDYCKGVTSQ